VFGQPEEVEILLAHMVQQLQFMIYSQEEQVRKSLIFRGKSAHFNAVIRNTLVRFTTRIKRANIKI